MALRPQRTDADIIAEVLAGDSDDYAILVIRYQGRITSLCFSMLGEEQAALDAAQDIFIKAFKGLPGFRGGAAFSTWLYRIGYNHCCSVLERRKNARTESLDAMPPHTREAAGNQAPLTEPIADGAAKLAAQALRALPPAYRAAFSLRLQGESYSNIASASGVSVDSVKARLRRARVILRAKLSEYNATILPSPGIPSRLKCRISK
jgi:RNA polymerase sigma-70 factor (ECF subfamily)